VCAGAMLWMGGVQGDVLAEGLSVFLVAQQ
jgi:hypothetical protein